MRDFLAVALVINLLWRFWLLVVVAYEFIRNLMTFGRVEFVPFVWFTITTFFLPFLEFIVAFALTFLLDLANTNEANIRRKITK